MKFIIAAALRVTPDGYSETSGAELVVKMGNQFDQVIAEVEASIPNGYVLDFTVQVFVENFLNPSLSSMLEGSLQKIIDANHKKLKSEES